MFWFVFSLFLLFWPHGPIDSRIPYRHLLLPLLLCWPGGLSGTSALSEGSIPYRPHIILIVADDMGYQDVGFRDSDILTPNLDRLAGEGVVLENHYVMPQCSPTRASLLSGRYAIRTGFWTGNIPPNGEWGLRLNETTMADMLKRNGYRTHAIGKWHCGMHSWQHTPVQRGFDTFLGFYMGANDYFSHEVEGNLDFREDYYETSSEDPHFVDKMRKDLIGSYNTDLFTDRAVSLISQHNSSQPLFIYLAYNAPHWPFQASEDDLDQYTSHMTKSDSRRRKYAAMVSIMDRGIGRVVGALESYGLREDTLLVFTSDNGGGFGAPSSNYPLRGGKRSFQEGGVRAVSFVNSPLLEKKGYVNRHLHHVTDWYRTFQVLARDKPEQALQFQHELDGFNIWDSISHNKSSGRDEVLLNMNLASMKHSKPEPVYVLPIEHHQNHSEVSSESILDGEKHDFFVLRQGAWKLFAGTYLEFGWTSKNNLKSNLSGYKRGGSGSGSGMKLYNLEADPLEENNVADDHPDIVNRMMSRIPEYKDEMTWIGERTVSSEGRKDGGWYPWVTLK